MDGCVAMKNHVYEEYLTTQEGELWRENWDRKFVYLFGSDCDKNKLCVHGYTKKIENKPEYSLGDRVSSSFVYIMCFFFSNFLLYDNTYCFNNPKEL